MVECRDTFCSCLTSARLIQVILKEAIVYRREINQMRKHQAALQIQSFVRMIGFHVEFKSLSAATVALQAFVRGRLVQRRLNGRYVLVRAATCLQSYWRKSSCQLKFSRTMKAVVHIQSLMRTVIARRTTHQQAANQKAGTRIQACWRGLRDRRQFAARLRAIVLLQGLARGCIVRLHIVTTTLLLESRDIETPLKPIEPTRVGEIASTVTNVIRDAKESASMKSRKVSGYLNESTSKKSVGKDLCQSSTTKSSKVLGNLQISTSKISTRPSQRKPLGAPLENPPVFSLSKARRATRNTISIAGYDNGTSSENCAPPSINGMIIRPSLTKVKIVTPTELFSSVASIVDNTETNNLLRRDVEKLKVVDLRQELKAYGLESKIFNKMRKADLVSMVVEERSGRS